MDTIVVDEKLEQPPGSEAVTTDEDYEQFYQHLKVNKSLPAALIKTSPVVWFVRLLQLSQSIRFSTTLSFAQLTLL